MADLFHSLRATLKPEPITEALLDNSQRLQQALERYNTNTHAISRQNYAHHTYGLVGAQTGLPLGEGWLAYQNQLVQNGFPEAGYQYTPFEHALRWGRREFIRMQSCVHVGKETILFSPHQLNLAAIWYMTEHVALEDTDQDAQIVSATFSKDCTDIGTVAGTLQNAILMRTRTRDLHLLAPALERLLGKYCWVAHVLPSSLDEDENHRICEADTTRYNQWLLDVRDYMQTGQGKLMPRPRLHPITQRLFDEGEALWSFVSQRCEANSYVHEDGTPRLHLTWLANMLPTPSTVFN